MHYCPMDSQSSSFAMSPAMQPRGLSYKRRRNGAFTTASSPVKPEDECDASLSSTAEATSGESSSDDSDSSFEVEDDFVHEEEEAMAAAKRRRRADLDGLKNSVRRMEAQVMDASAQLRDLAALVAQVVAQRQQQVHA